jgi:hypothetical protein
VGALRTCKRSAASNGSRASSVSAASFVADGFALALKRRTFWMYSRSETFIERFVESGSLGAVGVAARGPRAAHPASSVAATATTVLLRRMRTRLSLPG